MLWLKIRIGHIENVDRFWAYGFNSPRWPQVLGASFLDRLQNQNAPPLEISHIHTWDKHSHLCSPHEIERNLWGKCVLSSGS